MSKTAKAVGAGPRGGTPPRRGSALTARSQPALRMTKAQASRRVREARSRRLMYGLGAVLVVGVLVAIFGFFYESVWRANEPIAAVHGRNIATVDYAKVLGFKQMMLDAQQRQIEQMAQGGGGGPNDPQGIMQQFAQQQLSQIRRQRAELENQTVEDMMNAELMRDEAKRRGLSATPDEINEALVDEFGTRTPAAQPTPTSAENQTEPAPPPAPTPTPPATAEEIQKAREQMASSLKQIKLLSEQEFITWIIEPKVLHKKLNDAMADSVSRTSEQVHARHILVDTQEEAQAAIDRIKNGEDFAAVAAEVSKDTSNKDKGGDLGWFPRGQMVAEFERVAFAQPIGELSRPVRSQFGYHVIEVLEKGERELSDDQYVAEKQKAVDNWLKAQRADAPNSVQFYISSTRQLWARDWINRNLKKDVYGR